MGWGERLKRALGSLQGFRSHTKTHEDPTYGRVLEVALAGKYSPEALAQARQMIEDEVARQQPQYLVVNVQEFESVYAYYLAGPLVGGYSAMQRLGGERKTRIVAAGPTGARMQETLLITKLAPFFGGGVYSDLESALSGKAEAWPSLAKCKLEVVLNQPAYAPGEKISGIVRVSAEEELACRKLTVSCGWIPWEPGKAASERLEQHLFSGTWQAGAVASYPFEFTAAAGPFTCPGPESEGTWLVHARAELAGRFDVWREQNFWLVAGEPQGSPVTTMASADKPEAGDDVARELARVPATKPIGKSLAWAYAFRCKRSLDEIVEILNTSGPWKWSVRESHWYGFYVNCRPLEGVRIRIHGPETSVSRWFRGWRTRYTCQVEIGPESVVSPSAIDGAFRALLRKLPVHRLREIDTYD